MADIYVEKEFVDNILTLIKDRCETICGHLTGEDKKKCIRACRKSIINSLDKQINMDDIC